MMVLSGISGALALVMGGLAIWAWTQRNEAVQQRKEAVKQKGIAEAKTEEAKQENYANVIALAKLKIDEGLSNRAEEMLWGTPQELRNWEWGHLMQ